MTEFRNVCAVGRFLLGLLGASCVGVVCGTGECVSRLNVSSECVSSECVSVMCVSVECVSAVCVSVCGVVCVCGVLICVNAEPVDVMSIPFCRSVSSVCALCGTVSALCRGAYLFTRGTVGSRVFSAVLCRGGHRQCADD